MKIARINKKKGAQQDKDLLLGRRSCCFQFQALPGTGTTFPQRWAQGGDVGVCCITNAETERGSEGAISNQPLAEMPAVLMLYSFCLAGWKIFGASGCKGDCEQHKTFLLFHGLRVFSPAR